MAIDVYRKLRATPLYALVRISDDHYMVNAALRGYHNTMHATMVVQAVNELTGYDPSLALLIAAQWHDAVYFPNAGSDANERCSSAALGIAARELARSVEFTQEQKDAVNKAQDLIEYTSVEYHLHRNRIGGELAILLDADLSSLAAPYGRFVDNQHYIIQENGGVITAETCKLSAMFLGRFLRCRKYIYHTEKGRELWETIARVNIATWMETNEVDFGDEE
jgi:predicted metal-dependent HD superfamily phosphohydrolase